MSLTKDEYKASLLKFYKSLQLIKSNEWNLETVSISKDAYLKKLVYMKLQINSEEEEENIEIFIKIEYHIIYSVTYQVPVLYFRPSYYQGKHKS